MNMPSMVQQFVFLLLITLLALWSLAVNAAPINHTSAKQAIMVDYQTGTVLYSKNAHQKMPTSSMSKVMTTYMVFEALHHGKLGLHDKFRISEKAWKKGGSKMFVKVGDRVSIDDLLNGILVQSGNDATIVVAEGMAGSEKAFAEAMTLKAKELGMENSQFKNASGWPVDGHYSTAHDLAVLAKVIFEKFPDQREYFSRKEFTYNNITQKNRNPLLYRDIGADGLKTGHTEIGGYGLMATGTSEETGRRVILVVNGLDSIKDRANESARLLKWGLNGFDNVNVLTANETVTIAPVLFGASDNVTLTLKDDVYVTVPKLAKSKIKMDVEYQAPLIAPIKANSEVGVLHVDIPEIGKKSYKLYTASDVNELGFFKRAIAHLKYRLSGAPQ